MSDALLVVEGLARTFGGGRSLLGRPLPALRAVRGVDLTIRAGETLGVVGESGCGKSTLARMLVGLDQPSSGRIEFDGADLAKLSTADPRALARKVQYVFQDPIASLNPRKTIRQALEAPMIRLLGLDQSNRRQRLSDLMASVHLRPEFLDRYPHEFSGGQAQRIGIARALAANPKLIVLDEPVSALDVSIQAQILKLLAELKRDLALTYVFISHDLAVVESVSDRVAVMYFGRVVEIGTVRTLYSQPGHPYTRLLIRSAPVPGRTDIASEEGLQGLPDPFAPPRGCAFAARCSQTQEDCLSRQPELSETDVDEMHAVACWHPQADCFCR